MSSLPSIRRYMTPIPYTIEPGMSVRVAVELMRRHGFHHLPVEQDEQAIGILSASDILSAPSLEKALSQSVASLMTRHPYRVNAFSSMETVLQAMTRNGVDCVLVVDDRDRVIGIFTEKDALRAFAEATGIAAEGEPLKLVQ